MVKVDTGAYIPVLNSGVEHQPGTVLRRWCSMDHTIRLIKYLQIVPIWYKYYTERVWLYQCGIQDLAEEGVSLSPLKIFC